VCTDITRDVMTKVRAGTPAAQIRRDVDARYGKVGKPMPTPLPK
jgi:cytochrome c-type biogenesis protein CcmH/NrfF